MSADAPRSPPDGRSHDEPDVIDALPYLDHPDVRRLLALSLHEPDEAEISRLCAHYARSPVPAVVFGLKAGGELVAIVGALAPEPGRCEVRSLAVSGHARRRGYARKLIAVAARALQASDVEAETDSEAVGFYRACGFALEAIGEAAPGVMRYRARRAAPDDAVWFSAPRAEIRGRRDVRVSLPPGGNTLPLVPDELADADVPAFVIEWILEANEVGMMLQQLLPDRFPPTTPPIRPQHIREILGPATRAAAAGSGTDPDAPMRGLPAGVELPMAVLDVVEMGERIGAWIDKGHRVRQWAEAAGHGDAPWIVPDLR